MDRHTIKQAKCSASRVTNTATCPKEGGSFFFLQLYIQFLPIVIREYGMKVLRGRYVARNDPNESFMNSHVQERARLPRATYRWFQRRGTDARERDTGEASRFVTRRPVTDAINNA